jgi:two-component system OmpR family sensor kinase
MNSIRQRLAVWLLLGLSAATLLGAWSVYVRARAEARKLFDYQMQLTAASFPDEGLGGMTRTPGGASSGDVVVVQIWDRDGTRLYLSRPESPPPRRSEIGFSDVRTPNGDWRVYTALVGNNVIQVSQPSILREELAAGMALRTMSPLLILLPLLIGIIWFTIGRSLKPVNDVAGAVAARSADALDPLPDRHLPQEVRPLVTALNGLLDRLGRSLDVQRAFVADAAHELRTPLTALRLQIQLAERATTDAERLAAFERLKGGAERATRLVEQLLAMARSDPEAAERAFVEVDLTALARATVAELAPLAEAKGLDLGFSGDRPVTVQGDPESLRVLLENLVDNAIRYTPAGGTIDVAVAGSGGTASLSVADDGPGIPPDDRERVFDRFYRRPSTESTDTTGSGLGLAIVRRIAQRHHASVELGDGLHGRGLKVAVQLPPGSAIAPQSGAALSLS